MVCRTVDRNPVIKGQLDQLNFLESLYGANVVMYPPQFWGKETFEQFRVDVLTSAPSDSRPVSHPTIETVSCGGKDKRIQLEETRDRRSLTTQPSRLCLYHSRA